MDSGEWKNNYPDFEMLDKSDQEQLQKYVSQSASGFLMQVLEDTFSLYLDYL